MSVPVGIVGVSGYVGAELVRLLSLHPHVKIKSLISGSNAGRPYESIYPQFLGAGLPYCEEEDLDKAAEECEVLFLAIPHGNSLKKVSSDLLEKCRIIDMSADFRLRDPAVYEQWYHLKHSRPELLPESVYGLPELKRKEIGKARLVANPGCYTTASILSLFPLLKEDLLQRDSIIIDAKSGTSGAGKELKQPLHYSELNENFKAYSAGTHRHTPEIEALLSEAAGESLTLSFTPHLIPMTRGILVTIYARLKKELRDLSEERLREKIGKVYRDYYEEEFFIRLKEYPLLPETKHVKGSNFMDIGFAPDRRTGRIIISGALDNMIKGAAGQAVQNMNLLLGQDEKTGLQNIFSAVPG